MDEGEIDNSFQENAASEEMQNLTMQESVEQLDFNMDKGEIDNSFQEDAASEEIQNLTMQENSVQQLDFNMDKGDKDEIDSSFQEDAVSEEIQNLTMQENSVEQLGFNMDKGNKDEIDSSVQEDAVSEEIQNLTMQENSVEQLGESDDSFLEIPEIEKEDQQFDKRLSDPLSPDIFDVERYVAREPSIHLEEQKSIFPDEHIEAYPEQDDRRFSKHSDVGLEEESEADLEEQPSAGLEEQSSVRLEEQSSVGLEEQSGAGLEEQIAVSLAEEIGAGLEEESSVGLEEESSADLEEQSDLDLVEQSEVCLDEESYIGSEQYYTSSVEEKSESEKYIVKERKVASVAIPDRQKLIETYQSLQSKESVLLKQNYKLQMRLAARLMSLEKRQYISMPDKADMAEKYKLLLGKVEEMWKTDAEQLEHHIKELKELTILLAKNQQNFSELKSNLLSKQKHTAFVAINSRTGRHICPEGIEMCFNRQAATEEEIKEIRLKYVKEKRRLRKIQNMPSEKDTSPGSENVHFLLYEELRIASETNQMQLEKLTQELRKMDNVFSTYVQMVTHTKEKLFDLEPDTTFDDQSFDEEIVSKKEELAFLKQKRNEAATRLERLRSHFGILSDQNLLRHYDKLQNDLHSLRIDITATKSDLNKENAKK